MSRKYKMLLFFIIVLALVLRVVGINHGFPFIFHPDEATVVRSALGLRFNLNPGHFDWPHLFIYLNYFLYMAFAKLRSGFELLGLRSSLPGIIWNDGLIFYLLSRWFAAILGALTLIPVFLSAKKLFGHKQAIFSALVFAILPFHVWHSHYSLIDVPMVFFLSWAFYFAACIFVQKDFKNYILAGLFIGLAGSTKYNGALGFLVIILAHLYRVLKSKDDRLFSKNSLVPLFSAGIFSALGFVAGTPFSVLDAKTFIRTDGPKGALWQLTNVGRVGFLTQLSQFFQKSFGDLPRNLGIPFWLLYIAGFCYTVFKLKKSQSTKILFCLYISSLFYFFYVSGLEKTRAHYFMIAYPLFALVVGYFITLILERVLQKKLRVLLLVLIFMSPLAISINNSLTFVKKDTRNILYAWVTENAVQEDVLIYDGSDLDPLFKSGLIGNAIKKSKNNTVSTVFSARGYLVVTTSDDGLIAVDSKRLGLSVSPVLQISDENRRGPFIQIYKLPIE